MDGVASLVASPVSTIGTVGTVGTVGTLSRLSCSTDDLLDPLSKSCPDDIPCRVLNPDLWFAESPSDLDRAKQLCQDCPARLACLAGALERREPWGVWGGEIFVGGAVVARKRPRGRPRKTDVAETAA